MKETPSTEETAAYYQDFSLQAGAEDWRRNNGRHLRIHQEVARLLGAARGLRVLDVGCGTGVLTSELCRYGDVTGTDFSAPAIALAAEMEPRAAFVAGRFQDLDLGDGFDLITLFDVLEHVPLDERSDLFAHLDRLLSDQGWLILTTPHPGYTRWLHQHEPSLLQIVDEPVSPKEVVALAAKQGLDLIDYRTYDVDRPGVRQYQLLAFARPAGRAVRLPAGRPWRRLMAQTAALPMPPFPFLRRGAHALRLVRGGRSDAARWLLGRSKSPPAQSER